MSHPHHCLVTQKLQSTYLTYYTRILLLVVKYVYMRILLLDLTHGRTMGVITDRQVCGRGVTKHMVIECVVLVLLR